MGRGTAGNAGNGDTSGLDDDGLETTAKRASRASRSPRRSRRARALAARATTTDSTAESTAPTVDSASDVAVAPALGGTAVDTAPTGIAEDTTTSPDDAPQDDAEIGWKERLSWILITVFLALTVLALTGVAIYLSDVVGQWEERTDELTDVNYSLGDQVAAQEETIESQTQQIDILTNQLNTAQDRISALANQSANSDDDLAYAEQRIELLSGYASTGAAIANALTRCVDGQEQLVEYLVDPGDLEEEEIVAYAESVDSLCTAARESNTEFQALLAE